MRHVLGPLLLAAAAVLGPAACGDKEPRSTALDHRVVALVTQTAAGGEVGRGAAYGVPAARAVFVAQFGGTAMTERLDELAATTEVPAGSAAYAAVVAIGCDAPTDVTVDDLAGGPVVEAVPVEEPQVECLAPMTTVAFVLVPASAL